MRAGLLLSLLLGACVDLDRYAPLGRITFAPIDQLVTIERPDPSKVPLRTFTLADVDGDRRGDLVYANQDGSLSVHRAGARPGSDFDPNEARSDPGVVPVLTQLLARDLDGDGAAEIVAAGLDAWKWSAGRPQALGAFVPRASQSSWAAFGTDDATADLWYVTKSLVQVDRWDGAHFDEARSATAGTSPGTVLAADLDDDGVLDVIEGPDDAAHTQLRIFWDGLASIDAAALVSCGPSVVAFTLDDVDGDGRVDLLAVDASAQLVWCKSLLGRAFDGPRAITALGSNVGVSFADLDRDRRADLVIVEGDYNAPTVRVLRGTDGGFTDTGPPVSVPGYHDSNLVYATQVLGHDLDADGKVDLVVWAYDGLYWLKNVSE